MRRDAGLTLIELSIALAIAAVLAVIAVPSWSKLLQHHRLNEAARSLAADLGEARQEAIRRNQPVQLLFGGGGERWCYALVAGSAAAAPDCNAGDAGLGTRLLKRVRAADHPGVDLVDAQPMRLGADGAAAAGQPMAASLANARGEQLRVRLSLLGRASICSLGAPMPGIANC